MAACQGDSCRQGRESCKTPSACGLLVNGAHLSAEPLRTLDDRYGLPVALALFVICVVGLVVLLNWPHLSRWLGA